MPKSDAPNALQSSVYYLIRLSFCMSVTKIVRKSLARQECEENFQDFRFFQNFNTAFSTPESLLKV